MPSKPVVIFEAYIPNKFNYLNKFFEILNAFVDVDHLKQISFIQDLISLYRDSGGFDESLFYDRIVKLLSGFSYHTVTGRYMGANGPIDESVNVVRFIIQDCDLENDLSDAVVRQARDIIRYLVTKRFAEEIGLEDEIWFLEYKDCILERWVSRKSDSGE